MPLAFDSISHGTIAFGFFNIESDMLLLENNFFFADIFCSAISEFADTSDIKILGNQSFQGYVIPRQEDIGDLMGAIHKIRYTGFIGEVYRLFPFPERTEGFKQNPEGFKNQARVTSIISRYGTDSAVPFGPTPEQNVQIGDYLFDIGMFQALVTYVWNGGYPRWKDGLRPDYLLAMKIRTNQSKNPFFTDFLLQQA